VCEFPECQKKMSAKKKQAPNTLQYSQRSFEMGDAVVISVAVCVPLLIYFIACCCARKSAAFQRIWAHRMEPTMIHLSGRVRGRLRSRRMGTGSGGLFRVRGTAPTAAARRGKGKKLDSDIKDYLQRSHALSSVAVDQAEDISTLNDAARAAMEAQLAAVAVRPPTGLASGIELRSAPGHAADIATSPTAGVRTALAPKAEAAPADDGGRCSPFAGPSDGTCQRKNFSAAASAGELASDAFLTAGPGERGPEEIAETLVRCADGFGLELHKDEDGRGAIAGVYGEARRSALRAGDRITSVNGTPVDTHEQVLAAVRCSGDDLFLIVLRDPQARPVVAQGLGLDVNGGDLQDMEL
jgi:hypothetical protein